MKTNFSVTTGQLALAFLSLTLGAALRASATPPWDHDPMGVSIGSPAPLLMTGPPTRHPHPPPHPKRRVTADPALNQIVVETATPIRIRTGNPTQTNERFQLECYSASPRNGRTLRLHPLREGDRGDYSVFPRSAAITHGFASFTVRFHHRLLTGRGRRPMCLRRVYLLTFKGSGMDRDADDQCLQAVTVLSDDPACFSNDAPGEEK